MLVHDQKWRNMSMRKGNANAKVVLGALTASRMRHSDWS